MVNITSNVLISGVNLIKEFHNICCQCLIWGVDLK